MKENIIGRKEEQNILERVYHSKCAEFVAVCGRRRVGKTFLIREFYEEELVFSVSGLAQGNRNAQIKNFYQTLQRYDPSINSAPHDWLDVFHLLITYLSSLSVDRKVILLDEMPWMDTPRSGFIAALEHFWNGWASARKDIVLIVCGSATSWMMDKLINNKGGLYNRLTKRIFLEPFTLHETELLLESNGFHLSRYEIAECYMIMGGIPFYLNLLRSDKSLAQNIDLLFFNTRGELHDEFSNLYAALFKNSNDYVAVVSALSKKSGGMTRDEIQKMTGLSSGGGLTEILKNLDACGFIRKYNQYSDNLKDNLYQLTDFFTLFHFKFIKDHSMRDLHFWSSIQRTAVFYSWAGHTFELLVLAHISQIKQVLGISGVLTNTFAWRMNQTEESFGAQIDLVIDRQDQTINLCEIKYAEDEYLINADYEKTLRRKVDVFQRHAASPRKSLQLTMITTFGVAKGKYNGVYQNEIVLDDLFQMPAGTK